ncbi:lipopolysaccharide biosynthesis protein [Dyadobacter sp. CY261]|uniref:lipopolysaccharide biosynthesis protein n=1 Tax=Dyadobacter sp. CY261 TaxID=2907203 RepID=UPI001F17A986|nr:lipopolysaccharide biosynthesis protein [Dyadobacter sp. CY261]MCF0072570.1 lipopolysaccharide biosynthesis protein [Dyadobacter sp. CY261]
MENINPDSFERSVFSGIRWNLIISFGGQLSSIGFTLLLSRMLGPDDFGLLAAAMALTGLIETFGTLGSASALTQRAVVTDRFYSAVLVVTSLLATLMMLAIGFSSSFLASFYNKPQLRDVFLLLMWSIPFQAIETFPLSELQRRLAFDKIAFTNILSIVVSGVIAVWLAYSGHGWIALGARLLLVQSIRTITLCAYAWPKFKFRPALSEIKELLRFGLPQSLSQFLLVFGRKIDDILIGKWMGTSALGIYSLAYSLYVWPVSNIKGRISQVIFAAFSKIQADRAAMGNFYLKTVSLATLIGFPAIVGFSAICDLAVPVLMGDKWLQAIPILRILGFASLFEVCVFPGAIYQAIGQTKSYLKIILITRMITAMGILFALLAGYGIDGVATSIVATSLLSFLIYNHFVKKIILVGHFVLIRIILKNSIPSVAMLALILMVRYFVNGHLTPLAELALSVFIGAASYWLLMKRYHPEILATKGF